MIRVFLLLHSPNDHHRQIEQGQRIEQDEQPVGAYGRMQGEEEQEGNDATAQALQQKHQGVPHT